MTWMQSSRVGVRTIAWVSSVDRVEVLEQRQAERGGLAGAGLGLADHVLAAEHDRDRLLLDRGWLFVAELVESGEDVRLQA